MKKVLASSLLSNISKKSSDMFFVFTALLNMRGYISGSFWDFGCDLKCLFQISTIYLIILKLIWTSEVLWASSRRLRYPTSSEFFNFAENRMSQMDSFRPSFKKSDFSSLIESMSISSFTFSGR